MPDDDLPAPVQRLYDVFDALPGVAEVELTLQPLDELSDEILDLPGESGDLPHLLLRRGPGVGQPGEQLVSLGLTFTADAEGWVALEFLAWWVRDESRGGQPVQMRPLALPPVGYGLQLGRTLHFVIEWLLPHTDGSDVIPDTIDQAAESLAEAIEQYQAAIDAPTQPARDDDTPEVLTARANLGDAAAMLDLADHFDEEDPAAAFAWLEKAAATGHPTAHLALGQALATGRGTTADLAKAVEQYRHAAEAGSAQGMALLGRAYQEGEGVEQDAAQAVEWYEQGGDAGEPACYAQLGDCYESGVGVPKDDAKALEYYELALEQGFDEVAEAVARLKGK